MFKKTLQHLEGRNAALASNFAKIAAGRSIERLRQEMKEEGFDIGQGTLARLARGETGVRMESIRKLAAYARMPTDELLRDEGAAESNLEFVQVPRVGVKFSNGHGQVVYYEDDKPPLSFRADFLRKMGIPAGAAVVVDAEGISNEPKIHDGAVVLINSADTGNLNGDFFAFRVDGELLIKRLSILEGTGIVASAENSDFKPKIKIYTDMDGFEIIGRVRWMGVEL